MSVAPLPYVATNVPVTVNGSVDTSMQMSSRVVAEYAGLAVPAVVGVWF